ncbi:hypothetical protein SAMN05660477_00845 [Soonwooa buanensis]|uniref:Uncharacterized protein n=1 Tax=Soonwooa buanensis TaxID=619805 RepID=A0A1T5DMF6_9FLAO|nr:hypothetical protein [Soonwooa buanensis]SKB72791.1 hypothetical protein SAMN05660477_00845 [Soonwooa buanensis]
MKNKLYILGIFINIALKAQVGINTTSPQKMLDVNGDLNIRKELRVEGTDLIKGNSGSMGQLYKVKTVLPNQILTDSWKTVQIAKGTGSLSLFYLNTVKDTEGVEFDKNNLAAQYVLNESFTAPNPNNDSTKKNWAWIKNAKDVFTVTKSDNKSKAILSLQTVVQITANTTSSASFACGIFVSKDGGLEQLKAVRNDVVRGPSGAYKVYNLNVTLDELSPGIYTVRAACANRNLNLTSVPSTKLGIGKAMDQISLSNDMAQTTLTTSVLQTY